ncbi:MAG: hypothetical protein DI543_11850 [Bradyrhizobium icense]|jgi:hypothetical protein|nr:MAG: hypothetical protein DI543_11850 [Bradyrhizobium icense]
MRQFALAFALLAMTGSGTRAAELAIPPRQPAENVSMQKGPANCSRWTDECVSCSREAEGEAPVCSNIGIACQPKAVRCIGADPAKK